MPYRGDDCGGTIHTSQRLLDRLPSDDGMLEDAFAFTDTLIDSMPAPAAYRRSRSLTLARARRLRDGPCRWTSHAKSWPPAGTGEPLRLNPRDLRSNRAMVVSTLSRWTLTVSEAAFRRNIVDLFDALIDGWSPERTWAAFLCSW